MRLLLTSALLLLFTVNNAISQNSERVELPQFRDMVSKTYMLPNGKYQKVIYGGPVQYQSGSEWLPINTDIVSLTSSQWAFANESNVIKSRFPSQLSFGNSIQLEFENEIIEIGSLKSKAIYTNGLIKILDAAASSIPDIMQNQISYSGVYPNFDDTYEVSEGMFKNNVLLQAAPSEIANMTEGYYGFTESMTLPEGWSLKASVGDLNGLVSSSLEILDVKGETVAIIPAPMFYDTQTETTDGSGEEGGVYKVDHHGNEWQIATLIPVNWLSDSYRSFPVTIDPSVILLGSLGGWQSPVNFVNNNGFVFVGVCCSNGWHRAWIKFDISGIPDNSCVNKVEFQAYINGVGASTAEEVEFYNGTEDTGLFGNYSGILPAVFADFKTLYYASQIWTGTGYYPYLDLGAQAAADVQNQLTINWYEPSMVFVNEPSVNWKRLTGNMCSIQVTYSAPPCVVLPVEFVDFEIGCKDNRAELTWKTVTEQNNDYFTIWRSTDGLHFSEAGTVDGIGNSQEVDQYMWTSNMREDELSYYKISQTDFSGATEFFEAKVFEGCSNLVPSVFVNNGSIVIEGKEINSVIVTDYLGRQITSASNAVAAERIEMPFDSHGTFLVMVTHHNGLVSTERIIK